MATAVLIIVGLWLGSVLWVLWEVHCAPEEQYPGQYDWRREYELEEIASAPDPEVDY